MPYYGSMAHNWLTENKTGLRQLTFPDEWPISLDDAASYARVSACSCEGQYVETLLSAATAYVEQRIGMSAIIKQFEATYDSFPPQYPGIGQELPMVPVVAVDRIQYLDESEQRQTLDTGIWELVVPSEKAAYVQLKYGKEWPPYAIDRHAAVFIRFTAGYGNQADDLENIPAVSQLRHAVRLLIVHWTNLGRDPVQHPIKEIPFAVTNLIDSARPGFYHY